jgi:Uma2 family endonuclease
VVTAMIYSLADFERLGEATEEYEVFDGELVQRAGLGRRGGRVGFDLGFKLGQFVKPRKLGQFRTCRTNFVLATHPLVLVRPTVAFVRAERLTDEVRGNEVFQIPPDLAVELTSSWDTAATIRRRTEHYQRATVPLLWVVRAIPQTISVLASGQPERVLGVGDDLDGGEVLPGFRFSLAELFSEE